MEEEPWERHHCYGQKSQDAGTPVIPEPVIHRGTNEWKGSCTLQLNCLNSSSSSCQRDFRSVGTYLQEMLSRIHSKQGPMQRIADKLQPISSIVNRIYLIVLLKACQDIGRESPEGILW